MRDVIDRQLLEIERRERVRILLAVESGSRAWGFASPDSDYDVRFLYVRPRNDYLRLERFRDVIELPVDEVLDINGWDLNKALRLLHGANPTLFEWLASPVVYRESAFVEELRAAAAAYFAPERAVSHYLSMAVNNSRTYLKGDRVKGKKYFYVLRPILACRWILERGTPPPVPFSELAEAELDPALRGEVESLLERKRALPEIGEIPRVEALDRYLDQNIQNVRNQLAQMPKDARRGWEALDRLFLSQLE